MEITLEDVLKQSGNRLTRPRSAVFNHLAGSDAPQSIADISLALAQIDRTSIYRTLELFTKLQIVTILPHGWKQKYELAEPFKPHHHHFHCDNCGHTSSIESPKIETLIHELAASQNATATSHTFEIHGLCQNCQ